MLTPEQDKSYKIIFKFQKGNLEASTGRFLLIGDRWNPLTPPFPTPHQGSLLLGICFWREGFEAAFEPGRKGGERGLFLTMGREQCHNQDWGASFAHLHLCAIDEALL
jgi:hypothetical protein